MISNRSPVFKQSVLEFSFRCMVQNIAAVLITADVNAECSEPIPDYDIYTMKPETCIKLN